MKSRPFWIITDSKAKTKVSYLQTNNIEYSQPLYQLQVDESDYLWIMHK